MIRKSKKTVYLDHAAATALDRRVYDAMRPFLTSAYGNPSSLHHKGVEAKKAIDASRQAIAEIIGARPEEIVFTSGGTESCNLAILGIAERRGAAGHIITTSIEHHAVLEPVKILQKEGWEATFLPVDGEGFVSIDVLKKAVRENTILVSVMYANNEIGTIEPVAGVGHLISRINIERRKSQQRPILFHADACQAARYLDLNVNRLQVDLMSVSASKIYGPKGVGFLYVRRGTNIAPIIHGGGQERGIRSGTENVAGIVGMAKALGLVVAHYGRENKRLIGLRDYLFHQIRKNLPKVILNGPSIGKRISGNDIPPKISGRLKVGILDNQVNREKFKRLPNNINITIPGVGGEALMLYLDAYGICVSTGSACATSSAEASHALKAIGKSAKEAKESIRITLGKEAKKSDLDYFVKALKNVIPLILDGR